MSGQITVSGSDMNARIEWKISNFYERYETRYISPKFEIFNCECDLNIRSLYPGFLCMHLFKYAGSEINCECIMGIMKSDGSEKRTEKIELLLPKRGMTDTVRLIANKDLRRSRYTMVPDDCLTVFCNVHLNLQVISDPVVSISSPSVTGAKRKRAANVLSPNNSFQEEKGFTISGDSVVNEYFSDLSVKFKDLYLKKLFTDVTIKVGNEEFTAHKLILIARSKVFAAMFEHDSSERRSGIVEITDCDPDSFEDFLLFLYTADVKIVSSRNVVELFKISDKYGCNGLLKECVRCMIHELSVDAFPDYFQLAIMYNDSDLLTAVTNFFLKNATTIFPTTKWLALLEEHPSLCNELLMKFANAV